MPEVFIQILEAEDTMLAQQVWQLREELLRQPLGLSLRDEDPKEEAEDTTFYACTATAEVIGCVMLRPLSTCTLKLRQMAVSVQNQRMGIGRQLLETAEAFARAKGFREISLHARQQVIPFYEQAGFESAGTVFTEVGIPHRFMIKTL
ncbi:MAG: GNAT family N-acetyltransferase [Bacteroidetes bacterium]|nr:GNAT family N-acetyltransferase [Bacteroidota bacterium]MBS1630784.1 GNAT family N-acetyltransferase [Bacteroidota bacterium]